MKRETKIALDLTIVFVILLASLVGVLYSEHGWTGLYPLMLLPLPLSDLRKDLKEQKKEKT